MSHPTAPTVDPQALLDLGLPPTRVTPLWRESISR